MADPVRGFNFCQKKLNSKRKSFIEIIHEIFLPGNFAYYCSIESPSFIIWSPSRIKFCEYCRTWTANSMITWPKSTHVTLCSVGVSAKLNLVRVLGFSRSEAFALQAFTFRNKIRSVFNCWLAAFCCSVSWWLSSLKLGFNEKVRSELRPLYF